MRFLGYSLKDTFIVGAYFAQRVKVQRGIKGKTRSKVDEVLICGVPRRFLKKFVSSNKILFNRLHDFMSFKLLLEEPYE